MSRCAPPSLVGIFAVSIALRSAGAHAEPPRATPDPKAPKAAETGPDNDVRALFDKGVAAVDQGDLPRAEALFTKALALRATWDVATNLGVVEHKLHRDAAAAAHLRLALRVFPPSEAEPTRKSIEKELASVLPSVALISVHSNEVGAAVHVGGALVGTLPLDAAVPATPGTVTVEITKEGFAPVTRTVEAAAGATVDITVPLTKVTPHAERSWAAPAVAFGFGGLGLLTGVVAGAFAAGRMADLSSLCGKPRLCPESARGAADDGRAAAHLSTSGFVLAGLGAAVGVGLLVLSIPGAPAGARVTTGLTSVGVEGSF
ncbi:MAG: PEGA domain-containing protein [Polyangiaceae bacterium]